MADDTENLVLEHLRALRSDIRRVAEDVSEIKTRLEHVEDNVTAVNRRMTNIEESQLMLGRKVSDGNGRLERIEKRLSLIEEPA